jgi:hypothetical protein
MLLLNTIVSVRLQLCLNINNEDEIFTLTFFFNFNLLPICGKYVIFKARNQASICDYHDQYQLYVLAEVLNKYCYLEFWSVAGNY